MNRKLPETFVLAIFSALNSQFSKLRAQGSLTSPGAPAPTMKTVDLIEARTLITNAGAATIPSPGSSAHRWLQT